MCTTQKKSTNDTSNNSSMPKTLLCPNPSCRPFQTSRRDFGECTSTRPNPCTCQTRRRQFACRRIRSPCSAITPCNAQARHAENPGLPTRRSVSNVAREIPKTLSGQRAASATAPSIQEQTLPSATTTRSQHCTLARSPNYPPRI